ncbi:MAG TPA: efflux RND transporter periplasmic adaptor subunit [Chthoniobacterales bacterium]|nr:efflux RND transporter periplasmic adaptor subunit [Chthoniobacterales bacterium]
MKKSSAWNLALAAAGFIVIGFARQALAHEGHAHAPGEEGVITSGPITITAEAKANLALKVEEAQLRTLEKTLSVIGQIEPIPSRSAAVTSRIPGRVVDIKAMEGQAVKKGEVLIEIESRQVGNPPPRVQYSAPIDGVVTDRDVVLNDSIEPDKHLLEIVDMSELYAEGRIFEGQIAQVKAGQKVRVTVESFPGETFTGSIDLIGGALEPETRTLKIWARVANPEGRLRPNMRATLNIVTGEADSVVAIPHSAVLGESGNLFAFVQTDEPGLTYERRSVVAGIKDDQYVEIIEGILPTEKVVTLGNYQLQYVTSVAKPELGAESRHLVHDHGDVHGAGAKSTSTPLMWMGAAVIALLALNLVFLIRSRRSRTA